MIRVEALHLWEDHEATVDFSDGTEIDLSLDPFLAGPRFAEIRAHADRFHEAKIDPRQGGIVWPNGAGISAEELYARRPVVTLA